MDQFTENATPLGLYDPQFEHDACGIGAVVDIKGRKSHQTVSDALSIVEHLEHRAGKDAEGKTGDGVGIMLQISHKFFSKVADELNISLGNEREYGVGMFFFPQNEHLRAQAMKLFELVTRKEGLEFLAWRRVPVDPDAVGQKARDCMPSIWQCFIKKPARVSKGIDFDRRLYIVRRVFEQASNGTYVPSLSSRTIVYKGMFLVHDLRLFRKFFDLAADMPECISLGVGEPDFKTPWAVREAGIESLEHGRTRYTANAGLKELRAEICRYLERRMHLHYDPLREVLVTVGGSEAIDMCIRTIVQPGDEVIIPEPCFVCYEPITTLSGGVPVHVPCRQEDEFRLRPEALKAAITPKTKLLIMPFPNNPTGAVMEREDLEAIAEVLRDTNVMVLSDEIYAELNYGLRPHVSIATLPGMAERTIVVNGFSKSYAMTGWRLGYACGPAPIIKIMTKIHQSAIMSAPTTSQYAAITALRECDGEIDKMRDEYNMRRRLVVRGFNSMGLTCFEPRGAFYAFPCIKSTGMTSQEFCTKLLEQKHVALVPGDAFGASGEGYCRVSYAYSVEHLTEAMKRIREFLKENGVNSGEQ